MPICRECKKDVVDNYQTIQTKRKSTVVICDECLRRERKEAKRARDSKQSV